MLPLVKAFSWIEGGGTVGNFPQIEFFDRKFGMEQWGNQVEMLATELTLSKNTVLPIIS